MVPSANVIGWVQVSSGRLVTRLFQWRFHRNDTRFSRICGRRSRNERFCRKQGTTKNTKKTEAQFSLRLTFTSDICSLRGCHIIFKRDRCTYVRQSSKTHRKPEAVLLSHGREEHDQRSPFLVSCDRVFGNETKDSCNTKPR